MALRVLLSLLLFSLAITAAALPGCRSANQLDPAEAATTQPMEPTSQPAMAKPAATLAYLKRILQDDTRLIEVYVKENERGALDDFGRKKLIDALPGWFTRVGQERNTKRFKITPDMGILIYAPGTADGKVPAGAPMATIHIYSHRGTARVTVNDPDRELISLTVQILQTPEPKVWMEKLFAGKL